MPFIRSGWSLGLSPKETPNQRHTDVLIAAVQAGFTPHAAERLKNRLSLSTEEFADLLRVSTRTLARRQKQGRLAAGESDLLYRFARLYEQAVDVMDNEADASY
jgi:putative toxin-antitoxin system antitoxin component (TIGR02293 family)